MREWPANERERKMDDDMISAWENDYDDDYDYDDDVAHDSDGYYGDC